MILVSQLNVAHYNNGLSTNLCPDHAFLQVLNLFHRSFDQILRVLVYKTILVSKLNIAHWPIHLVTPCSITILTHVCFHETSQVPSRYRTIGIPCMANVNTFVQVSVLLMHQNCKPFHVIHCLLVPSRSIRPFISSTNGQSTASMLSDVFVATS